MSIKNRIADAQLLYHHGTRDGALLALLVAVAATSRRRYPDRKRIGDAEAFVAFVSEEMLVITQGMVQNYNVHVPGADVNGTPGARCIVPMDHWRNASPNPEDVKPLIPLGRMLYKFVRCSLTHEGGLPDNVQFRKDVESGLSVEISDETIYISDGYMDGLSRAVAFAPENADEFPEQFNMPDNRVAEILFGSPDRQPEYIKARRRLINQLVI